MDNPHTTAVRAAVDLLDRLRADLAAIDDAEATLAADRRSHALAAAKGDKAARRVLDDVAKRAADLIARRLETVAAAEAAEAELAAAREAAAAADLARRRAEAAAVIDDIMAAAREADAAFATAAAALTRRAEARSRLAGLQVLPGGTLNRLAHRFPVTAAMGAAGLPDFADIHRTPAHHRQALADTDAGFVAALAGYPSGDSGDDLDTPAAVAAE